MSDEIEFTKSFAQFISESPTSYHAVAAMGSRLEAAGFAQLDETRAWDDVEGKHFVIRDGALIAWRTPLVINRQTGLRVVGSHTDSPALKLKPKPVYNSEGWAMLNLETYGGLLLNSWLDRELGLAGRLVTKKGEVKLVSTKPLLRIPQLAPHLDRSVNESLTLSKQQNMMPFYGFTGEADDILAILCEAAGIDADELGYYDVFTYPTEAPAIFGAKDEFFAASRMDNLSSVFPSLEAFIELDDSRSGDIAIMAAFDHEEVGSGTRSGASGPFLGDVIDRLADLLGFRGDAYRALIARSSCISADAGHSVNPNYVSKHDPVNHPIINGGPVLKINANQRYATDGVGSALWFRACDAAGVKSQTFVGNNDVPCGTTIGPLTATRIGLVTVDVGIPLLSMHSARELAGTADLLALRKVLGAYWEGA